MAEVLFCKLLIHLREMQFFIGTTVHLEVVAVVTPNELKFTSGLSFM